VLSAVDLEQLLELAAAFLLPIVRQIEGPNIVNVGVLQVPYSILLDLQFGTILRAGKFSVSFSLICTQILCLLELIWKGSF